MITKVITIQNRLGLHARAASKLVEVAQAFGSIIEISHGEHAANGKSIMSILMLQATNGTHLNVRVTGDDETQAMDAIEALIINRFGEDE